MPKIQGKRVFCLITGASQGIGQTIAVEFAKLASPKSKFLLLARSLEGLKSTEKAIESLNKSIAVKNYACDLGKSDLDFFSQILQDNFDKYDLCVLVHNAGSEGNGSLAKDMNSLNELQSYMSLNVYSVTLLTSSFLKTFQTDAKTIVNITSLAAVQPFKSLGYYCVGKAAREMYFKVLAEENPDLDILSYSPGPVKTDMVTRIIGKVADQSTKQNFESMVEQKVLLSTDETVKKLIDTLEGSLYKSGGRIDYYDR